MRQIGRLLALLPLLLAALSAWAAERPDAGAPAERIEARLKEEFRQVGAAYPPERVQFIALKDRKVLELWAWQSRRWHHIRDYPIFAASGTTGPKLREGDKQVPEGFYRVAALNPNSHYHLSLKLDFPNRFDWLKAMEEGREKPGSNIFIHGSSASAGCLAMGNQGVEEIFMLAKRLGVRRVHVMIAPYDFRRKQLRLPPGSSPWVGDLYAYIKLRLAQFPLKQKRPAATLARWTELKVPQEVQSDD